MSHTILVVEDDLELCEILCEALYFSAAPEENQASPYTSQANIRYSFPENDGAEPTSLFSRKSPCDQSSLGLR